MMTGAVDGNHQMNGAESLLAPARALDVPGPAVIAGDQTVTYPELDSAVCQMGHMLKSFGVGQGERVLLLADDRVEFFFAYLGAMKIGAVPVALNLRLTPRDLAYIIDDSRAVLIAVDDAFAGLCAEALGMSSEAPHVLNLDGVPADLAAYPTDLPPVMMGPQDMAFWLYTSGTTGHPKAVVHNQNALSSPERYLGPVYGVGPGDKIFCSSKLFFAFSLGHILFAGLKLGATVILHAGWPSGEAVQKVIEDTRPDVVLSVPTLYAKLISEHRVDSDAFRRVRHYLSAGEKLPVSLFERWRDLTGKPILEGIGATEALIMFIGNHPDDYQAGTSGKPHPQTDVRLTTDTGEEITQPGIPGVLWVRSASIAREYWNQPDKTAAAFQDGWYRTGDVLMCDEEGRYSYQGRADDMLKISGQWVSPAEIEDEVLADPNVREAAVIGIETEDGFVRLALCLVPQAPGLEKEPFETALCDTLSRRLSIYKCPRRFVYLDEMPRTATGKLQRFRLRQIASDYLRDGADSE